MNKNKYPIGFMQGRLSNFVGNVIQSFPWDNWENEFLFAKENSLCLMEWTLDAKDLFKNPIMSEQGRKKISYLSKKFNLFIPSLTGDCFMQEPFWKSDNPDKLQKVFISVCESASKLGIQDIVVPLVDNGSLENSYQYELLINYFNSKRKFFIENKLRILFESDFNPIDLKKFISRFPDDIFGVNYDIGNSAALNFDSDEEFLNYGNRILNIHIKDRKIKGSTLPLGQGDADFAKVFKNIFKINYGGNYILQTARARDNNHINAILKYKNFVISLLDKYS